MIHELRDLFLRLIRRVTERARSTVSSAPGVVGVPHGAELTVGRVRFFFVSQRRLAAAVTLAAAATGCERGSAAGTTASSSATVGPAAAASAVRSCKTHCKLSGLCAWDAERDRCVAASDEDCARSDSCKNGGLCAREGVACVGTSEAHCRASEGCRRDGACSFTSPGLFPCVAQGEDCKASESCRRKGRCTALGGACQVKDADDCAASEACTRHGQCSAKPTWQGDVTVFVCAALSNDDCARGDECKTDGRCSAVDGACR